MKKVVEVNRAMLLAYLDQRREFIDEQITLAAEGSKDELYWMAAWAEATSIHNAIFTSNYNHAIDVHHRELAPTRRST